MNYYSPSFVDNNILKKGFTGLWFINRPYHIDKIYKKESVRYISDNLLLENLINDKTQLVIKFDDKNFLTHNKYPYSKPNYCVQYVYWTKNNHNHNDVLDNLIKYKIIKSNMNYMIWQNSPKLRSIKTIKHYHVIVQINNNPTVLNIVPNNLLQKIIMITRHGPREPILQLPKLDKFSSDMNKSTNINHHIIGAQLTEHGKDYCNKFGTYIKKLFSPYFYFDINKTLFASSNIDRTIDSALYFYQGLFDKYLDKTSCYRFKELLGDIILSDDETIEYKKIHDEIKLEKITSKINAQINECFGYNIESVKDYFNVLSTIKVYEEHNLNLPKEWTPELNNLLEDISTEYYYKLFSTKFKYIFTQNLVQLVKKFLLNPNITFAYLSTHDVVVYPFALRFTKNIIKLPNFCSNVRIEIWNNDARIYYDDNLLKHLN
jgi:hypothetical protein